MSIHEQRQALRPLLDDANPGDAPTAYYALFHDPSRSTLAVAQDAQGQTLGFAGVFQTGLDLFRPLVTLRCPDAALAADLLADLLTPGRPYLLFASADQLALLGGSLRVDSQRVLEIHRLQVSRFEPLVNVLVQCSTTPDGLPRCAIHSNGAGASAGVNWQSPAFAEIFVNVDPQARRRGWGISVASSVTETVVNSGRVPLYLVEAENEASLGLAHKLGYVDSGVRQVFADVVYEGHPGRAAE